MSQDFLSQEEVDSLLRGVESPSLSKKNVLQMLTIELQQAKELVIGTEYRIKALEYAIGLVRGMK